MDEDRTWLTAFAVIVAVAVTVGVYYNLDEGHWIVILVTFIGSYTVILMSGLVISFAIETFAKAVEAVLGLLSPLRIVVLLALAGGVYYFYQSAPKTMAECAADEIRRMGQGTRTAAQIAIVICEGKGF